MKAIAATSNVYRVDLSTLEPKDRKHIVLAQQLLSLCLCLVAAGVFLGAIALLRRIPDHPETSAPAIASTAPQSRATPGEVQRPEVEPGNTDTHNVTAPAPGLLYVDTASIGAHFLPMLMQTMRRNGLEPTGDPSGSFLQMRVSFDASVKSGTTVGSLQTWVALADTNLSVLDTQRHVQVFMSSVTGHGRALDSGLAKDDAVADGLDHLINEYKAHFSQ